MPSLLLGPMLRYVGEGSATVWVETDGPCEVEVLGHRSPTFCVAGHNYAVVAVAGLPTGGTTPYQVALDGRRVWPLDDGWPPSVIRDWAPGEPYRLAWGSCRVTAPMDDPEPGVDALDALAERMRHQPVDEWPHDLLFVGDQVYADENISPQTREFTENRRDTSVGAGPQVADFEEYTRLYQEAWSAAPIRWLLSTVPSAMIFDDHDVHDDWNTSAAWRRQAKATPWWSERITGALMAYWLYQHLGNLEPAQLAEDDLLSRLRGVPDGEAILRAHARRADAEADGGPGIRWSYRRTLGTARLLVIDSRCGRVLAGKHREMVDEEEWAWIVEQTTGDVDHLLIATSLPYLLPSGVHGLEAWNEAVCAGRWGRRLAGRGEQIRQAVDLEHWAAFGDSFARMTDLVAEVGSGTRGRAPATITFLSGDVHFAYVAEGRFPHRPEVSSRILQAVCSPLRNPLPQGMRYGQRLASSTVAHRVGRWLAGSAGVPRPEIAWSVRYGPAFGNEVATLKLAGRHGQLVVEAAVPGPALVHSFSARLS